MAFDWIAYKRKQGKETPWADYIDERREQGVDTPWADKWYKDATIPDTTKSAQQICAERVAAGEPVTWQVNSAGLGQCVPTEGIKVSLPTVTSLPTFVSVPTHIRQEDLAIKQDPTPVPYTKMGAYGQAFSDMLNSPAFGNQTLEELENARVAALQGDLENQYGFQADEMTKRLNRQAAAQGMYGSSSRTGNIEQGLSELGRQQMVEFNKGAADIRGQRPELLLKEREQRSNIANMWGQMDLDSQKANLDAMLNNKLMEYDRQFKTGQLTIDAFNGNVNQLALFLDYMVSSANTANDTALISAKIDEIYANMTEDQKAGFRDWVSMLMGGMNLGGLGNG
jgi:hypothetical protein